MLVRRFTLVCLLTALAGLYFARLAADAGRDHRPREIAGTLPALFAGSVSARS